MITAFTHGLVAGFSIAIPVGAISVLFVGLGIGRRGIHAWYRSPIPPVVKYLERTLRAK